MKAHVKLKHAVIEVEAPDQISLFDAWASAAEVFGQDRCGVCGCQDISPVARRRKVNGKDFTFREFVCQNQECHAYLSFGKRTDADALFPKRKLLPSGKPDMENGSWGAHNGWTKYRGEDHHEEEERQVAQANAARRPAPAQQAPAPPPPARPQPAPRPAPAPEENPPDGEPLPQPAQVGINTGPVMAKLLAIEAEMVAAKFCRPFELVDYVRGSMQDAGHGDDAEKWPKDVRKARIPVLIAEFRASREPVFHDAPAAAKKGA